MRRESSGRGRVARRLSTSQQLWWGEKVEVAGVLIDLAHAFTYKHHYFVLMHIAYLSLQGWIIQRNDSKRGKNFATATEQSSLD